MGIKRLNLGELPRAPKAPKAPEAVDKVDAADVSDPQCIVPYLQDIHRHYREEEVRRPSLPPQPAVQCTCCAHARPLGRRS